MTNSTAAAPRLSIVIPVLNETENLPQTFATLPQSPDLEVIVVDGGSTDGTIAVAESWGARVVRTSPGRAQQMNLGARLARGEVLLFLHGDTRLPAGFAALIDRTLAQPTVVAGAFELHIDGTLPGLRLVEWGVKWRSRLFQMPYGDQALFLKAKTFQSVGGFAELPIMEDFELVRRLRRLGRVAIVPAAVLTHDRRWRKLGVLRTTLINQGVIAAYFLGMSPDRLAHWYRRQGKRKRSH